MGLFSKLFGGKSADDFKDEDEIRIQNPNTGEVIKIGKPLHSHPKHTSMSGDSWGPVMPAEENQFNSGLSYQEYFSKVFNEEFPSYQIEMEDYKNGMATIYTFYLNGTKKLVVEVISRNSSRYKLYLECRQNKIAHRKFYYNYQGWWNTRSYVTRRVKEALGIA